MQSTLPLYHCCNSFLSKWVDLERSSSWLGESFDCLDHPSAFVLCFLFPHACAQAGSAWPYFCPIYSVCMQVATRPACIAEYQMRQSLYQSSDGGSPSAQWLALRRGKGKVGFGLAFAEVNAVQLLGLMLGGVQRLICCSRFSVA